MKKFLLCSLFTVLLLLTACALAKQPKERLQSENFAQLIHSLADKEPAEEEKDDFSFLSVPARSVTVGEETISVYEYDSNEAMEIDAACIHKDGLTISIPGKMVHVSWAGLPNFFKNGNVIVLYVGSNAQILTLLAENFGASFAGQPK